MQSISAIQQYLRGIYGVKNRELGFDYLYGYLCKNLFRPRKAYDRRGSGANDQDIYIKSISYLLAIANLFDVDLQDVFLRKFPKVCPYCLVAPCRCIFTSREAAIRIDLHKKREELETKATIIKNDSDFYRTGITFEQAFEITRIIYPNNTYDWNNHGHYLHFRKLGEEAGELHEACCRLVRYSEEENTRKLNTAKLLVEEEIADVFAWCVSEWGLSTDGIGMTKTFLDNYPSGCSSCNQPVCGCHSRNERNRLLLTDILPTASMIVLKIIRQNFTLSEDQEKQYSELEAVFSSGGPIKGSDTPTISLKVIDFIQPFVLNPNIPRTISRALYDNIAQIEAIVITNSESITPIFRL